MTYSCDMKFYIVDDNYIQLFVLVCNIHKTLIMFADLGAKTCIFHGAHTVQLLDTIPTYCTL